MNDEATGVPPVPPEAWRALEVIRNGCGESLRAVYLHGSATVAGLRPGSDVDLLAVVDESLPGSRRELLRDRLLAISGRHPALPGGPRSLELIVFRRADLVRPACPARADFIYGEWLRGAFEAGSVPEPAADPEYTLLLAQARGAARPLYGPEPAKLLPAIPASDVRRAIVEALPALLTTLDGDERNVLLTLARMWRTMTTGAFVPKDAAAAWAFPRLGDEAAGHLARARLGYLGLEADEWLTDRDAVRRTAEDITRRVQASATRQVRWSTETPAGAAAPRR